MSERDARWQDARARRARPGEQLVRQRADPTAAGPPHAPADPALPGGAARASCRLHGSRGQRPGARRRGPGPDRGEPAAHSQPGQHPRAERAPHAHRRPGHRRADTGGAGCRGGGHSAGVWQGARNRPRQGAGSAHHRWHVSDGGTHGRVRRRGGRERPGAGKQRGRPAPVPGDDLRLQSRAELQAVHHSRADGLYRVPGDACRGRAGLRRASASWARWRDCSSRPCAAPS